MASRVTLKAINDELARRGHTARLAKAAGYFYFQFGEAADWLDRTVDASIVGSRTLDEWVGEFDRLAKLNRQLGAVSEPSSPATPGSRTRRSPQHPKPPAAPTSNRRPPRPRET